MRRLSFLLRGSWTAVLSVVPCSLSGDGDGGYVAVRVPVAGEAIGIPSRGWWYHRFADIVVGDRCSRWLPCEECWFVISDSGRFSVDDVFIVAGIPSRGLGWAKFYGSCPWMGELRRLDRVNF